MGGKTELTQAEISKLGSSAEYITHLALLIIQQAGRDTVDLLNIERNATRIVDYTKSLRAVD